MPEHHHSYTTFVLLVPLALADHITGNLGSGCILEMVKHIGLPHNHKTPCPHTDAELLQKSKMDYTMRILFHPLVLVVISADAMSY
jgi:hypothetical protein